MNANWMSDARKIPDEVMDYLRRIAVRAIVDGKNSPELIAKIFQVSRSCVYRWLSLYNEGGYEALNTHKAPGRKPMITSEIDVWLKHTILHSTPSDYGYDTGLWTLKILAALLEKKFGIKVYESTVFNHLHRMNLSCQVPEYRSYRYDQNEVDSFISKKWPIIQKVAEKLGADIAFEDEAGIGIMTRSGRTWGEVNITPVVPASDQRGGYNVLSAITPKGDIYYRIEDEHITSKQYIEFLQEMIDKHPRPIVVVTDNVSFHRSKMVRSFIKSNRQKIRVFFLPKHAPNLNPDEQVWNEIKNRRLGREPVLDKEDLFDRIVAAFYVLRKSKDRIISFFHLKGTSYGLSAA